MTRETRNHVMPKETTDLEAIGFGFSEPDDSDE